MLDDDGYAGTTGPLVDRHAALAALYRLGHRVDGEDYGDDHAANTAAELLGEHTAVRAHGLGTASVELANFAECWASYCAARITGTGHEQYGIGHGQLHLQKMETATLGGLIDEAIEELADFANYTSFLTIKLLELRRRFTP